MKILAITLLLILLIFIAIDVLRTGRLISVGRELAEKTKPFMRGQSDARIKILIIGDSTAVGTGARVPEESIAGLVAITFPETEITNLGVNGAKTHELISRLESIRPQQFDLIMIHIGGNDIVRFTNLDELSSNIATVLKLATSKARFVTLTTTGNVGTAQLLPYGTRWLFEARTRKVRTLFMASAAEHHVDYIDLFREKDKDPFARDPHTYYAADIFHPSSIGYKDWYTLIEPTLKRIPF